MIVEDDGRRMPCGECGEVGTVCARCRRDIDAAARRVAEVRRMGLPAHGERVAALRRLRARDGVYRPTGDLFDG